MVIVNGDNGQGLSFYGKVTKLHSSKWREWPSTVELIVFNNSLHAIYTVVNEFFSF